MRLAIQHVASMFGQLVRQLGKPKHGHRADNGTERVPQLVSEHGQELISRLRPGFRLSPRTVRRRERCLHGVFHSTAVVHVRDDRHPAIGRRLATKDGCVHGVHPAQSCAADGYLLFVLDAFTGQHPVDMWSDGEEGIRANHVHDRSADDVLHREPQPIRVRPTHPHVPTITAASRDRRRHRLDHRAQLLLRSALRQ